MPFVFLLRTVIKINFKMISAWCDKLALVWHKIALSFRRRWLAAVASQQIWSWCEQVVVMKKSDNVKGSHRHLERILLKWGTRAAVALLVEQSSMNQMVAGSIPGSYSLHVIAVASSIWICLHFNFKGINKVQKRTFKYISCFLFSAHLPPHT